MLCSETEHPGRYLFIDAMKGRGRYCTVLVTVQSYQYFENK